MERTIKFRGQTQIGKKWVYGNIIFWAGNYQIWETEKDGETHNYQVIAETVGQFTGLTDKNGKEIYEGDVIEFTVNPSFYINAKLGDRYIIEYYGAGFFMKPINWKMRKIDAQNYVGLLPPYQTSNMSNHYEVIGNINENPELL